MPDIRQTAELDDFNRPNEDEILPPWLPFALIENGWFHAALWFGTFAPFNDFGSVPSSAWWSLQAFHGNVEVWARLHTGADLTEEMSVALLGNPNGYAFGYRGAAGDPIIGSPYYEIRRYNGDGTSTALSAVNGPLPGPNEFLMLRLNGSAVELWKGSTDAQTWTLMTFAIDNTYRQNFYLALRVDSDDLTGPRWDNFGGGLRNRQHMYRWQMGFGRGLS